MSCYEWERGTIKIPSARYADLKKKVRETHNKTITARYERLLKIHAIVKVALKGKRGLDLATLLRDWDSASSYYDLKVPYNYPTSDDTNWSDSEKLVKVNKLVLPLKKDFPLANSSTKEFDADDAYMVFDDKTRTVYWSVSENNRARDRAHDHPVAKALFGTLNKITWTRGSGGKIVGNDEYNRDTDYEGGGGNYVTYSFGPPEKPKKCHNMTNTQNCAVRNSRGY